MSNTLNIRLLKEVQATLDGELVSEEHQPTDSYVVIASDDYADKTWFYDCGSLAEMTLQGILDNVLEDDAFADIDSDTFVFFNDEPKGTIAELSN